MTYKDVRSKLKGFFEIILNPIIVLLNKTGITPNMITIIGLFINILGAYFIIKGNLFWAGIIILFAGIFDMLDGILARKMNKKTKFGGFLDSVTDRVSEGAIYFSILVYYININLSFNSIIAYCVMFLSFLISYIRARAGGLKIDCEEGIFTRPERIIMLILGLLLNNYFDSLFYALLIIGCFSVITIAQRIYIVYIRAKISEN
ncbi:MAG: CDP-alcohol phosphatidyltransferase family protein [Candidatus Goldbacteria bacterium]|nr:CDP-alcohol phosphatidyltransferase family protein [Candidatus Goldiibacteriota bacterium]